MVEKALIDTLKSRPDLTALLDVTFPESPEVQRMGVYMEAEYKNLIGNKPCKYEVMMEMLKTMA